MKLIYYRLKKLQHQYIIKKSMTEDLNPNCYVNVSRGIETKRLKLFNT